MNIESITTADGMLVNLKAEQLRSPPESDHWQFFIRAEHPEWGLYGFKVIILKSTAPSESGAVAFLRGDPLTEVRRRINAARDGNMDFVWPDLEANGWAVL